MKTFQQFLQEHPELDGLDHSTQLEAYHMWQESFQFSMTE